MGEVIEQTETDDPIAIMSQALIPLPTPVIKEVYGVVEPLHDGLPVASSLTHTFLPLHQ